MSESGKELFKSCSIFNEFLATKDKKKKKRVKGMIVKIDFVRFVLGGKQGRTR